TILGHGASSRLHRRLVRRDEIAESAGASTMALIGGNSIGFVSARCRDGQSPEQVEEVLAEEIERLITDGPTEEELGRAKATFARSWLQSLAHIDTRADQMSGHALLEGDPGLVNSRIETVEAIDLPAVAAAASHFHPDRRAVLT